jgi:hypothetical protein
MHPHLVFDLRKVPVEFATETDEKPIVGKFHLGFDNIFGGGRGGQRADAQRGLLVTGA